MLTLLIRALSALMFFSLSACNEESAKATHIELPVVQQYTAVPDFTTHKVVTEKKKAFFEFLQPIVIHENTRIANSRNFLKFCQQQLNENKTLTDADRKKLDVIAKNYKVKEEFNSPDFWRLLLLRVDVIPVSLALAQAALESAWGGSRFAREGNNLFGQWCFKEGCGLVPGQRQEGKSHEVASFESPNLSVRKYLLNLNRLSSYKPLRAIRDNLRQSEQAITGVALAQGLTKYSELGDEYIKHITGMITSNKLDSYDQHPLFLP